MKFSPPPPGVPMRYAHAIPPEYQNKDKKKQYDAFIKELGRRNARPRLTVHPDLETLLRLGTKSKDGGFGEIWKVIWSEKASILVQRLMPTVYMNSVVLNGQPPFGAEVAIKVQRCCVGSMGFTHMKREWNKETTVHNELSHFDFIPTLYFGFLCGDTHISCMEWIEAVEIHQFMKTDKYDTSIYEQVEKAFTDLWKAGYVHGDAHGNNIVVRVSDRKVFLIDFGSVVRLHPDVTKRVQTSEHNAVGTWYTHIQPHVNDYKFSRGLPWYNPNGRALKVLQQKLLEKQPIR